ncbi:family 3 O-methyltransferase [Cladochytrium replicatum]|nr:family 3 O-methyltransferase [Cladochytrium replicatum]
MSSEMSNTVWDETDAYLGSTLLVPNKYLEESLAEQDSASLPQINVSTLQGTMLEILVKGSRAQRVLEVGTLGGYSTLFLAQGVEGRPGAKVVTIELEKKHADVASTNLERAGYISSGLVEIKVGPGVEVMQKLIDEKVEPFDFIFLDADKESYPQYFELSLLLSRPSTMIVADNVVRNGNVRNPSEDSRVRGVQGFFEKVSAAKDSGQVTATAIQTVGSKGYDGFALIHVNQW